MVLGNGGREHALGWALARSPSVDRVLIAPGNAGTSDAGTRNAGTSGARQGSLENLEVALEPDSVVAAAKRERVELVVVGPEAPLCDGVVDALTEAGITAFGPTAAAARLEGSKAFMKRFAARHDIPTAPFIVTSDVAAAEAFIDGRPTDVVVKADGLAAGKGAIVCSSHDEAKRAARAMLVEGAFGAAGRTVVVEERLVGVEMSVHAICDGERYLVLPVSRDHKRVGDGDTGPNTGGMGAFAPVTVDADLLARIEARVLRPTLEGMRAEGAPYRGVLYAGVMVTADGTPWLLEHNVRFGDPETQVLMALLDGDVAELLASAARGALDVGAVTVAHRHAVVVVLASAGYPRSVRTGDSIEGLARAAAVDGVQVFHAGTRLVGGEVQTSGGRVLGVTAVGESLRDAVGRAYAAVDHIRFAGMQFRRDIAVSALEGRETT